MVLFVLRKLILQTRMGGHPVGLDVLSFGQTCRLLPYCTCANSEAPARLRQCADTPEPSLIAYVISTIISWAGSSTRLFPCTHLPTTVRFISYSLSPAIHLYVPSSVHVSWITVKLNSLTSAYFVFVPRTFWLNVSALKMSVPFFLCKRQTKNL